MNYKELLNQKIREQEAILNLAIAEGRAMTEDEQNKYNLLNVEITNIEKTIEAQEAISNRQIENVKPITPVIPAEPVNVQGLRVFKNFGDQLKAVKNAAVTGIVDDRLNRLNNEFRNAALGMNESLGSEGGFAVQTDFAGAMMESAATSGNILPLVDSYPISGGSNSLKWVDIDESSVATTVFGGVMVYWASEAGSVTAKKPALLERKIELEKLMGVAYATYELENDTNFVSDLYTRAFELAIRRELEACIVSGTGAGKPLGFLSSGSLVSVTKETGQASATVLWENIVKIYNRQLNKTNAVWLNHPDVNEQLDFLNFPIGVGGVPVYLQASAAGSVPSLKGRPIYESDHCSAVGTAGDINFVDLSQYMLIYKGGVQRDTSIHVQFLTAENCFRFIFRANGMPKKNTTLTIKNSSNTRSSFVTVGAR